MKQFVSSFLISTCKLVSTNAFLIIIFAINHLHLENLALSGFPFNKNPFEGSKEGGCGFKPEQKQKVKKTRIEGIWTGDEPSSKILLLTTQQMP